MITLVPLLSIGRRPAIDLTWRLLIERPPEANISHSSMPSMSLHTEFVMNPPYVAWYAAVNQDGAIVGAVLLTKQNEIGVAILKEHQRKGYAEAAIKQLMRLHKPAKGLPGERNEYFLANVAATNAASIALFNKLGKVIQWTYKL